MISENAGRGNADLARRDLYFTVTTQEYKLMATLKGATLTCQDLYDLRDDPNELRNRIEDPTMHVTVDALLATLFAERRELLASRGAMLPVSVVA